MRVFALFIFLYSAYLSFGQDFSPYEDRAMRLVQGISFSEDGQTLYFTLPHREYLRKLGKLTDGVPRLAIYSATREAEAWSEPSLLSFSGQNKDYEPTVSPDGKWLMFNTNRTPSGDSSLLKNDIWYSAFKKGTWQEPKSLSRLNTPGWEESYPALSRKGQLIYVAESKSSSGNQYGLYETRFRGVKTKRGTPLNLVDPPFQCGDPWISPEGDYLIFTRYDPANWNESCDLYLSFRVSGKWTKGVAIEELNSTGPDFSPAVSSDGRWIYFRRNFAFQKRFFGDLLKQYRLKNNR